MRPSNLKQKFLDARPQIALVATAVLLVLAPWVAILAGLSRTFRSALTEGLPQVLKERRFWMILLALVPIAAFLAAHPAPPDDLLRDLHAWRTGFDYRPMFWGSPGVQAGDYYLGFDWLVGWIDRAGVSMGYARWTWLPVVALDVAAWSVGLVIALRSLRRPDSDVRLALFVGVILAAWLSPDFSQRMLSGRPESFFALWALMAVTVESAAAAVAWVVTGIFLATWYWFFWIYVPAAILLFPSLGWTRQGFIRRAVAGAVVLGCGAAFWWVASGGAYLGWFWHLREAMHNRAVHIAENAGLGLGLFSPFLLLVVGAVWVLVSQPVEHAASTPSQITTPRRYAPVALLLLAAWFALPNMIRYMDSVISLGLAALWVAGSDALRATQTSPRWRAFLALSCVVGVIWMGMTLGMGGRRMPDLRLPHAQPGDRVLTFFSPDTYDVLYQNPGAKVAPAFEVGFSRQDIQRASSDLREGKVSCAWLQKNKVNWVVFPQTALIDPAHSPCLTLSRVATGRSVWRVAGEAR
jgi:hypothetical protein